MNKRIGTLQIHNDQQNGLLMRMGLWDFTVGTFADLWIGGLEEKIEIEPITLH